MSAWMRQDVGRRRISMTTISYISAYAKSYTGTTTAMMMSAMATVYASI
jgi:hypothetical protein